MSKKPKIVRQFTNEEILEALKSCPWPVRGMRPGHYIRVLDRSGNPGLSASARTGNYPEGVRVKHLVMAEKFMRPGTQEPTPLEIAIRHDALPDGTTRAELERIKTRDGTGWETLKQFVLNSGPLVRGKHDASFSVACYLIYKFPEISRYLKPLNHANHCQLFINTDWVWGIGFEKTKKLKRLLLKNEQVLPFLFQYEPDDALELLRFMESKPKRIQLLKKFLLEKLPLIPVWNRRMQCRCLRDNARCYAKMVLRYPEVASVLRPEQSNWHAAIVGAMESLPQLTPRRRQILAQYPSLCAALL